MRPREGDVETRCKAYQQARERAENIAKAEALKAEAWSLIEKLDVLMSEWTGVPTGNRSDEYHKSKRSIDEQLYYLSTEVRRLTNQPQLSTISELCGLRPEFLKTQISSFKEKKRPTIRSADRF